MALKLIANYSKRLGLPGYSSHQFSVCVETEITSIDDVAGESSRLYQTLQQSVDEEIQRTGFVPDHGYGMNDAAGAANGERTSQPANERPSHRNGNGQSNGGTNGDAWIYIQTTPIPTDEKPEAVEVRVEADLASRGLPTLVGVLDLVRPGGRIVDFKTAASTPQPEQAIHRHETQLSIYGLLYRAATGKRESALELHHLVKTKEPKLAVTVTGPVTPEQETRLYRTIESYVDGVEREDFVPSPGLSCVGCEYFSECRKWNPK